MAYKLTKEEIREYTQAGIFTYKQAHQLLLSEGDVMGIIIDEVTPTSCKSKDIPVNKNTKNYKNKMGLFSKDNLGLETNKNCGLGVVDGDNSEGLGRSNGDVGDQDGEIVLTVTKGYSIEKNDTSSFLESVDDLMRVALKKCGSNTKDFEDIVSALKKGTPRDWEDEHFILTETLLTRSLNKRKVFVNILRRLIEVRGQEYNTSNEIDNRVDVRINIDSDNFDYETMKINLRELLDNL